MTLLEVSLVLATTGTFIAALATARRCEALKAKLNALENSHVRECSALRREVAKCRRDLLNHQVAFDLAVEAVSEKVNPSEVIMLAQREATYEH